VHWAVLNCGIFRGVLKCLKWGWEWNSDKG